MLYILQQPKENRIAFVYRFQNFCWEKRLIRIEIGAGWWLWKPISRHRDLFIYDIHEPAPNNFFLESPYDEGIDNNCKMVSFEGEWDVHGMSTTQIYQFKYVFALVTLDTVKWINCVGIEVETLWILNIGIARIPNLMKYVKLNDEYTVCDSP